VHAKSDSRETIYYQLTKPLFSTISKTKLFSIKFDTVTGIRQTPKPFSYSLSTQAIQLFTSQKFIVMSNNQFNM